MRKTIKTSKLRTSFYIHLNSNINISHRTLSVVSALPPSSSPGLPPPSSFPPAKFPLDFACEMDKGFRAMISETGKIPARFFQAFGLEWHSSTYYTHHGVWSSMDGEALAYAVRCGHNTGGDWAALVRRHTKGKAKVK